MIVSRWDANVRLPNRVDQVAYGKVAVQIWGDLLLDSQMFASRTELATKPPPDWFKATSKMFKV